MRDEEDSPLTAALDYAARGWPVLALHGIEQGCCTCRQPKCGSPGKHPITRNGVKDATTDAVTIRGWWRNAPTANVGIATGVGAGLIVVDVDPRNGGSESLEELERRYGAFPKTPRANTGGGGQHIFLKHPGPGDRIPNATRLGGLPGLDMKADGGYVVAPPSKHASGGTYTWRRSAHPELVDLAPGPDWLLRLLEQPAVSRTEQGRTGDWLRLLQGVPQGERHRVATQIAGHYLGSGWDQAEVEAMLLGFAAQCDPPHDTDDIRRVVADLAAADAAKPRTTLHELRVPADLPWPTLKPAALHGLAGDIVRTIDPYTEADPAGVLISVLVAFGNAIGQQPHFRVEATRHPCRLFAALVGETAKGRKGTAWSSPRALFTRAVPEWVKTCITSGLSSGEGLIYQVRDARIEKQPVKKKGHVEAYEDMILDHGQSDKRLLVIEEEFSQALKVMRREGNILSPILRQAWDSGDLHPLTKANPIRATGAHISIIGHITRTELLRHLTATDQASGFANRFLWFLVRRSKVIPKPTGVPPEALARLVRRLRPAIDFASDADEVSRSNAAERLWADVYPALSEGKPGLLGAILGRAEVQALRLACIYALLDQSEVIHKVHLEAGLALWDYSEASAARIFGTRIGHPTADRILAALRVRGELTETEVHDLFKRHKSALDIGQGLELLEQRGLAVREERSTGGRPLGIWRVPGAEKQEN
jgi:hypothetical protein